MEGNAKTICGNTETCAPEIIANMKSKPNSFNYDNSIDIWSFGCMALFLNLGEFPFALKYDNLVQLQKRQDFGMYSINLYSNDISYEYIDIISHCLQKDCKNRLNMDQLLNHSYFKEESNKHHLVNIHFLKGEYMGKGKNTELILNINKLINIKETLNKDIGEIDSRRFLGNQSIKKMTDISRIVLDKVNREYEIVPSQSTAKDIDDEWEFL